MFDLPNAKRVRRDELISPASSSPPLSPQTLGVTYPPNEGLEKFFSLETFTAPEAEEGEGGDGRLDEAGKDGDVRREEEFEFRLFRTPVASGKKGDGAGDSTEKGEGERIVNKEGGTMAQATKIRIRSPTPAGEGGDGKFVVPFRGWRFYFSDPERIFGDGYVPERGDEGMSAKRREYLDAAVGGEQVLELKGKDWPGCHLPWRVTHIKAPTTGKQKQKQKQKPPTTQKKSLLENKDIARCLKKKNLGKKRRIILRKALAAQEAAKEADQEKRTRRNREKKVKRRQREREKKAATGGGDAAGASGSPDPGADTAMGGAGSDSGSE